MKRSLLIFFSFLLLHQSYANTYYWVGGTTATNNMGDRVNWSTAGVGGAAVGTAGSNITFTSADILIIDGTDISSAVGLQTGAITGGHYFSSTLNIAQLKLQNGADFSINGSANRTININGAAGVDLDVPVGCTFRLTENTSNGIMNLLTGTTGVIYGTVYLTGTGGSSTSIRAVDASGLTFNAGSFCYSNVSNGCFGITGSGTANSVVFNANAIFVQTGGGNPFQLAQPASFVVFNAGSLYRLTAAATALSITGRTYANLEYAGSGISSSISAGGFLTIDTLIVTSGTGNIDVTGAAFNIKGSISVASGATLGLSPASAATLTLSGTVAQTVSNAGTLTFGANQNIVVSNSSTNGVILNSVFTIPGSITVNNGSVLAAGATLTANGAVAVNGTFKFNNGGWATGSGTWNYGSTGTLYYNNTSGIYGTSGTDVYWPSSNGPINVTIPNGTSGVDVNSMTRTISGIFTLGSTFKNYCNITFSGSIALQAGYNWFNGTCGTFSYTCASVLTYNTGGTITRGPEWSSTVTPGDVVISNNTTISNVGGGNATICGSLSINSGSSLYMDYSGSNGALTIGKDLNMAGNLSLGTSSGDLTVGRNWTHSSGTFTDHGRAVFFNGSVAQTISNTATGTEAFSYLIINNTHASGVKLATGTNVTVSATSGDVLQLLNSGPLDLNGQSLTLSGVGGNIKTSGGVRNVTGAAGSQLLLAGYKTVTSASSGSLVTGTNVKLVLSDGLNFGVNLSTVNGTLQLNSGSYVDINTPFYGTGSLLLYNSGSTYNRRVEWSGTSSGGVGYPYHVQISNNTAMIPGGNVGFTSTAFNTTGDLTIDAGSAIYMNSGSNDMTVPLKVGGNLTINGTLYASDVAPGDVYVSGNWTRNSGGVFSDQGRAVFFDGSTNGTIKASGGQTFTYAYLVKSVSAAKDSLADSVSIISELGLTKGKLDLGNKNLTIVSTATATARIGQVDTANVSILYSGTGRFVIQRYFPARRSWRLLTAPLSGTGTIFDTWQNAGVYTVGKGTLVTGPNPTGAAGNGLDASVQNNPSLKTGTSLTNVLNTKVSLSKNVGASADNVGYFIFVRGDRNPVNTNLTDSNNTTLSSSGKIQFGDQLFNAASTTAAYTLVGNPYASPVDFSKLTRSNLTNRFYVWDPKLNTVGGYVVVDKAVASPTYTVTPPSPGLQDSIIQSSQAFFVETASNAASSITFKENTKVATNNLNIFRPVAPAQAMTGSLKTNLYLLGNGNSTILADGNLAEFNDLYSPSVDLDDAIKFGNANEGIAWLRNGKTLAVERRSSLTSTDTLFLKMTKATARNYRFGFVLTNLGQAGLQPVLEDNFNNTHTTLDIDGTTWVDFSVTADPLSAATDRFRIVFKPVTVLPLTFTSVKGWKQGDAIQLEWMVSNQNDVLQYEVERSSNGQQFSKVHTTPATNASGTNSLLYTWLDEEPYAADNFYRIRSVSRGGAVVYSNIVKISFTKAVSGILIYPNPVKSNSVSLQMNAMPAGTYTVRLLNLMGQEVYRASLEHQAGRIAETLLFQQNLSSGLYQLEINDPAGKKQLLDMLLDKP